MYRTLLVAVLLIGGPDEALRDFQARVDAYVMLHRALEAHTPPQTITRDPAQIGPPRMRWRMRSSRRV
jgi:hypothetical protein